MEEEVTFVFQGEKYTRIATSEIGGDDCEDCAFSSPTGGETITCCNFRQEYQAWSHRLRLEHPVCPRNTVWRASLVGTSL
jgi:hypothetical protein